MAEKYKKFSLTTDILVFSRLNDEKKYSVLLIKRKNDPYKNNWAIPGGFVEYDEEIDNAALRELEEETNIKNIKLKELKTFGKVGRDPRGRTVSVVYYTFINQNEHEIKAQDDAKEFGWFNLNSLPELAFDHDEIFSYAINKLELS